MKKTSKSKKQKKTTRKATANRIMPYIQSAVLCEKVLREERVSTLVRIIDTITISGPEKSITPSVINYSVHVAFKAGDALGKRKLKLTGWTPSGKKIDLITLEMVFKGDQTGGASVTVQFHMVISEEGVYWIDVHLNRTLMTRIPFRILYKKIETAHGAPGHKRKKAR